MSKKTLIIGGVGLVLLLCVYGAVVGGNKTATPTPAPAPKAVSQQAAGVPPKTETKAEAPKPAEPKPAPVTKLGTRDNPVPFGETLAFKEAGRAFTVGVSHVERPASALVKAANMFNDDAPAGQEYVAVRLKLDYTSGPQDKPWHVDNGGHRFYAKNRLWGGPFAVVMPEPAFAGQDIFPGATIEGWLDAKIVPADGLDEALLVYKDTYFALK